MASHRAARSDPYAALSQALLRLQAAERQVDNDTLPTHAASAARAAVRLMKKRPRDGAAQRAGLEALALATARKDCRAAALDAGSAGAVQEAARRFADDPDVARVCQKVAQRLLAAEGLPPDEALPREPKPEAPRPGAAPEPKPEFPAYAVNDDNARTLLDLFSPSGRKKPGRTRRHRRRRQLAETSRDAASWSETSTLASPEEQPVESRRASLESPAPGGVKYLAAGAYAEAPCPSDRLDFRARTPDSRLMTPEFIEDASTLSRSGPRQTVALGAQSTLTGSATERHRAPNALERDALEAAKEAGAPYADVDAELFLSAHGLPGRARRKRTVRLLERLFAPPAGTIDVQEARFLAALDFTRRERACLDASRAAEGGAAREGGQARGWSGALAHVMEDDGLGDAVADDEAARMYARRGGRGSRSAELDAARPSRANRLLHAPGVISEQRANAALARTVLTEAATRGEPPAFLAGGVEAAAGRRAPLKAADPQPLHALWRTLDPDGTGCVPASVFKTALRVAGGNALDDAEVDHLAEHYRVGAETMPEARLGLRAEAGARAFRAEARDDEAFNVAPPEPLVDYDLFVSSAKIGAAFGAPAPRIPAKPWLDAQAGRDRPPRQVGRRSKPTPPGARPAKTWDAHVKRVREDKSGAFAYLVRRGLGAIRHVRRTRASARWLALTAQRGHAVDELQAEARNAHRHHKRCGRAGAWLKARVKLAKRHRENKADALRFLAMKARLGKNAAKQVDRGRANPNRAWELHFTRLDAFEYLRKRGHKCIWLNAEIQEAREQLSNSGENAKATTCVRHMAQAWLADRAFRCKRAMEARAAQQQLLAGLARKAFSQQRKQLRIGGHMRKQALNTVAQQPRRQLEYEELTRLGVAAIARYFRLENAFDALHAKGACSTAHVENQARAAAYLRSRCVRLQAARRKAKAGADWLGKTGRKAVETSIAFEGARSWLGRVLENINLSTILARQKMARQELKSAVAAAKDHILAVALVRKFPRKLAAYEKAVKKEEAEHVKSRKKMEPEERIKDLVTTVFGIYDVDGSGEIDRTEFTAMMKNGLLLGLTEPPDREQTVDAFKQIDVDQSGAVSFDEFYKWFAFKREGAAAVPGLDAIVPPRDRAVRRLVKAYRDGEVTLEAKDMAPPAPHALEGKDKRKPDHSEPIQPKLTLAQRLAQRNGEEPGADDVVKRRLKARMERDMQEWADQVAADFTERCQVVFELIDADKSNSLAVTEILGALREEPNVLAYIRETPNKVLQEFLVPPRVQQAMKEADDDGDGEISLDEWNALAAKSLEAILEKLNEQRREDEAYIDEFLDLAAAVYDLVDDDRNGSLEKLELVRACSQDEDVIEFLVKCPHPDLSDLVIPEKLEKALEGMDTDEDGSISKDEWCEAIGRSLKDILARRRAGRDEDDAFGVEFLTLAREVFTLIDADESYTLDKQEVVRAVTEDSKVQKFLMSCGNKHLQHPPAWKAHKEFGKATSPLDARRGNTVASTWNLAQSWMSPLDARRGNTVDSRLDRGDVSPRRTSRKRRRSAWPALNVDFYAGTCWCPRAWTRCSGTSTRTPTRRSRSRSGTRPSRRR